MRSITKFKCQRHISKFLSINFSCNRVHYKVVGSKTLLSCEDEILKKKLSLWKRCVWFYFLIFYMPLLRLIMFHRHDEKAEMIWAPSCYTSSLPIVTWALFTLTCSNTPDINQVIIKAHVVKSNAVIIIIKLRFHNFRRVALNFNGI